MLARNFKTHQELEIAENVHDAFVTLLGMLERGELKHVQEVTCESTLGSLSFFNMNFWRCGTVGCFGGWVEHIAKLPEDSDSLRRSSDWNPGLARLFYPTPNGFLLASLGEITAEQGATALRSYLTTGDPQWTEALE